MRLFVLVAIFLNSIVFPLGMFAGEKIFRVDKPGLLLNTNRYALTTYSSCALVVRDSAVLQQLPCRIAYWRETGSNKCGQIEFSSVFTENKRRGDSTPYGLWTVANESSPMPKHLQIGVLDFVVDDNPPYQESLIVKETGSAKCQRSDLPLYRNVSDKYFRYLKSSETDTCFWHIKLSGMQIEHRIYPIDCTCDDFSIEEVVDAKSQYFTRMILRYSRDGSDFRLKKIILMGKHVYQGGIWKSDPASVEMRRIFVRSKGTIGSGVVADGEVILTGFVNEDGVVEKGYGVLKSRNAMRYKIFKQGASGLVKVELEVCDGLSSREISELND